MQKQTFTYPGSDLDRGLTMLAVLGSFWSRTYTAKDQVLSYVQGAAGLTAQTYQNILETVAAVSRYDVPVFHTQYWTPVTLKKSDMTSGKVSGRRFNDGQATFNDGTARFDSNAGTNYFYFAAPDKLVSARQLFNKLLFPTVALTEGQDFIVDAVNSTLVFTADPFANQGFLRKKTQDDNEEITLWAFNGQFDYSMIFTQFAYALGMQLRSSQNYKDLMNAVFDGLISGGATVKDLDMALSAICGIPLTVDPTETVEVVDYDNHGVFVSTDKHVYRFGPTAEPVVVPGQVVLAGTQLVRGFEIDEFFVGNAYDPGTSEDPALCCPAPNAVLTTNEYASLTTENNVDLLLDPNLQLCRVARKPLDALALDRGFLSACFYGDLVFENKVVPLVVDTAHPTGYTYVSFEVSGVPADVQRFFDEVHYRGITAAESATPLCPPGYPRYTLAQFLDSRKQPSGEPTAAHLPTTVNPLRFLVENVLRNNVFVVKIALSALGQNHLGLYNVRHLRQLLPPGVAMILIFDLKPAPDRIIGPDLTSETIHMFTGAEPLQDTVPATLLRDLGVTVRLFSGTCQ